MMFIAALLLSATQDVENPDYARWAKFKVGSWVRMKSEIQNEGNKMVLPMETTYTLLEIDDKRVVVEELTLKTLQPKDSPKQEKARKRTYQATGRKNDASVTEGDEEIDISGKKLACHWSEVKGGAGAIKTWVHPDVPGLVRMEVGLPSKSIQRLTATAWEKK